MAEEVKLFEIDIMPDEVVEPNVWEFSARWCGL